jgi:type III secretion protein J
MRALPALLLAAALLTACDTELQHGLTEAEANEILVLLGEHGVAGTKSADRAGQGFVVRVPRAESVRSWQLLQAHGLPTRRVNGFAETYGEPGLLPSPSEAHARSLRAMAGELERSLMALPSVLDARVHLVRPEPPRWGTTPASDDASRAAVLILSRASDGAATAAVDVTAVRRLVSGAVPQLSPERVEVVVAARSVALAPPEEILAGLGPFTVSRTSRGPLQAILAAAAALVLGLSAAVVILLLRLRRARGAG